jgi:biopolymer transport protein ExbD
MKSSMSDDNDLGIVAEINMIPLIDVALVLLIIFMVMTPYLVRSQIAVNLPGAAQAKPQQEQPPLAVQVDKAGVVYVDSRPVGAEGLEAALRPMIPPGPDASVVIEADKEVAFQHVVSVMDTVKKLGVTKMAVAVQKERKSSR